MAVLTGDYAGARSHAETGMSAGAGAAAFEVAGWAAYFERDLERGRRLADDGVRLAEDSARRASCLTLAGRIRHSEGDLEAGESRLREAVELAHGATKVVASVWLGTLRSHQGRVDEALDLLRPGTYPDYAVTHTFAPLHAHMFIGHALGVAGRAEEALRAFATFDELVERQHATRFRGRPENFTAWVLRSLGHAESADELNERAVALGPQNGPVEATIAAHLDLADGQLARGDLDGARRHLSDAASLLRRPQVLRWRQEMREQSLNARWSLAAGAFDEAASTAAALVAGASALGIPRYELIGRLLEARATAALGIPVDLDDLHGVVEALPR